MEARTLPIYNTEGKEVDKIKLDARVFDGTVNNAAIYQAVVVYRANQRKGLAAAKTRADVSGGGRKPWRQKGTGRARVGSIRSPLWRHGGVTFGPHARDFSRKLPQKIRNLALKSSLNAKVKENNFMVLNEFSLSTHKTKEARSIFSNLKINSAKAKKSYTTLLLLDKIDRPAKLALRNIPFLNFNIAKDANVYEVLTHQKLVITKEGLKNLNDRLKD